MLCRQLGRPLGEAQTCLGVVLAVERDEAPPE
ncbi:hypothetical protein Ae168Ps1_3996 [Pseudonocardia sp. Ae168_Ps1]|nr:hypothetical protein Ae168Ps1_3996 [Pseudonocardia sp. Ae168_Ps1]